MKRKRYYVNRDIQKSFIIFVSAEVGIITLFFLLLLYFNQSLYLNLLFKYTSQSEIIYQQIKSFDKYFKIIAFILLVGNVLFIALASMFFSHKIAGPLYRLEKTIKSIKEGGEIPENFNIRPYDFPKKLASEIQDLFILIKQEEENRKKKIEEIKKVISESKIENDIKKKLEKIIEEIEN